MVRLDNELRRRDPVDLLVGAKDGTPTNCVRPQCVARFRSTTRVLDRTPRTRSSVAVVAANSRTPDAELQKGRPSVPRNASLSDQRSPTAAFADSRHGAEAPKRSCW